MKKLLLIVLDDIDVSPTLIDLLHTYTIVGVVTQTDLSFPEYLHADDFVAQMREVVKEQKDITPVLVFSDEGYGNMSPDADVLIRVASLAGIVTGNMAIEITHGYSLFSLPDDLKSKKENA